MKSKATDPWAALDTLMKTDPEPTSPGWFTVKDFADRYKLSYAQAGAKCDDMHRAGVLRRWIGVSASIRRRILKYSKT